MYKQGDLRTATDRDEIRDARSDDKRIPQGMAYLPHSCDEWVIGGRNEVEALIGDLKKALDAMPSRPLLLPLLFDEERPPEWVMLKTHYSKRSQRRNRRI